MKPSKMLELVENLKVGEKVVIEKFKDHLFVEKMESEVRPFEEGDIVYKPKCASFNEVISIVKNAPELYVTYSITGGDLDFGATTGILEKYTLATDTQKQLLFDRLKADGKRWNPETKQLEDLNEPEIGDDVIVWNEPRSQDASITKMTTHSPFIWDMVVRWDGTKEQFDRVRNGGNK